MTTLGSDRGLDLLGSWIARPDRKVGWWQRHPPAAPATPRIRFAFYGRMSTDRFQDFETPAGWQRAMAEDLISGHGSIAVEFFDQELSRTASNPAWRAHRLLAYDRPGQLGLRASARGDSMRVRGIHLLSWALAALVLSLVHAVPASAAARSYAPDTVVRADSQIRQLASITLSASGGDKYALYARMQTENSTTRMLAEMRLHCHQSTPELTTTQNLHAGQSLLVLHGRYIFTAPASGTYTCRFAVRSIIPGGTTDPSETFLVRGSGTYLEAAAQPSWVEHGYQPDIVRVVSGGTALDVAVLYFTAPLSVSQFAATADVEMTNCYDDSRECITTPRNTENSRVSSRLQVMQVAVGGGYCSITNYPESGYAVTAITRDQHHRKIHHRVDRVSVHTSSDCTRTFRIKVYLKVDSGNDALVEGRPYTNTFVTTPVGQ